ncbi:aminoacyl--tRNA ligase-related protein [Achromobacter sp. JUb104]|uniref:aminoacyl--tRNA ligase-related protein n=1 Tax=Achromobacter sp. JUb104 TaxID=2940590 RepID=UPI002169BB0E|nr:aminoacyl--tRNA ligase-related protein [Achromobacter sp. JUb104]MCS3509312.1 threonyl-tRNA synthetase [Achromobacter sp. JUb104]
MSSKATLAKLIEMNWVRKAPLAARGQYHLLPDGALVFRVLADFLMEWISYNLDAREIRTPLAYNWAAEPIRGHSGQFEQRLFIAGSDGGEVVFRPGGDFGVMSMLQTEQLSAKRLPMTFLELCPSLRHGMRGELDGISRARYFTLIDLHTLALGESSALECYLSIVRAQHRLGLLFGFKSVLTWQVPKVLPDTMNRVVEKASADLGDAVLFDTYDQQKNYWTIQHHFHTEDGIGYADGQFDMETPQTFHLRAVGMNPDEQRMYLLHGAFDSVERWIVNLATRCLNGRGDFPLWLCPVQVRLLVLHDNAWNSARRLDRFAARSGVRLRAEMCGDSVAKRINRSIEDWTPFTVVFGSREATPNALTDVYGRGGEKFQSTIEDLVMRIARETEPWRTPAIDH